MLFSIKKLLSSALYCNFEFDMKIFRDTICPRSIAQFYTVLFQFTYLYKIQINIMSSNFILFFAIHIFHPLSNFLKIYKMGQDFLDIQYCLTKLKKLMREYLQRLIRQRRLGSNLWLRTCWSPPRDQSILLLRG